MASNEWLVRKLHEQDKKIEALSRGGTGVGHTSIAPGENLTVISDNGEVVLGAGGVEHVDGPTPATPSAPTLKLGFGTIETTWDGAFAEGEDEDGVPLTAPVDFDVVEVHCSTDPEEEEWGEDTMRGQIKTREGGTITVGGFDVDDEVFVCLIALAKTGKRSAPSATASLVIEGLDFSQLFTEIDAANATIKNAGEVLVTEQGTLDEKLTEVDGTLNDLGQDLQAVEDAQAELNTDLTDVMTSVDGKNTITWNPSAPSAVSTPGKAVGDLWYRTSGNSIVGFWKWDGTDWVTQLLDKTTIPLIDIGAGTFGSLSGGRLSAHSITSDRVIIGSGGNVVPWGQITAGSTYSPHEPYGPTGSTASLTPADPSKGLPAHLTVTRTSSGSWASIMSFWAAPGQKLPVDEGTEYVFTVRVYSANVPRARLSLFAYNHGGSNTGNNSGVFASSSGDALSENVSEITVRGKVPAGVGYCLPYLQSSAAGAVGVVSVDLRKAVGTTLIEDGAVSTQKLSADVLEVKNLKATSGQLNEAVINKLFSDVVVAKMAVAEEFIGENAILTGAVTAPKITASEELWAKIGEFVKIRAEHIEANAIDGMVVTGATYRTSGGTGSWSDAGLFIAQPDGTSMVRFPTDGSPLSLTASDTQIERASVGELDLSNGAVRSGGEFTLASGVTAPASPPELTTGWQKITKLEPSSDRNYPPHAWESLGYWAAGNAWVRSVNIFGSSSSEPDKVEIFDYATGSFIRSFNIELNPTNNLTVIGDIVYLFGDVYSPSGVKSTWIYGYNLNTGARTSRHEYTRSIQAKNALGNDGTNLIIASVYNLELWVHRRNPVTGVQVGSDMRSGSNSWPASGGKDLFGVRINGNDVEVVTAWGGRVYLNSNNALVRKTDTANESGYAGWVLPSHDVAGMAMRAGRFGAVVPFVVDGAGNVYEGSQFTSDTPVAARFTWFSGTNETTPSPELSGFFSARESPAFSMPTRAGLQKRLYFKFGAGDWNRVTLPETVTVLSWMDALDYTPDLAAPPTTNSFPNADPATLKSTNDTFEVKGDGSGHWGPLTFNADGTMTSSQIPEWVPVTTFLNGASAQTFGHTPAYRVWPDGKVEWRGVVAFPSSSNIHFLTVPTDARPAYDVHWACVTDSVSPGVSRVDICDPQAPTVMKLAASSARVWVSLDGIYYYKD